MNGFLRKRQGLNALGKRTEIPETAVHALCVLEAVEVEVVTMLLFGRHSRYAVLPSDPTDEERRCGLRLNKLCGMVRVRMGRFI